MNDLTTDLAADINTEHRAALAAAGEAVAHARRCGELLTQQKNALGHGEWLPWVEVEFEGSRRTAQQYMRLHRELAKIPEADAQRVAHLPLRDALTAFRQTAAVLPAVPDDHMQEVEAADSPGLRANHILARERRREQFAQPKTGSEQWIDRQTSDPGCVPFGEGEAFGRRFFVFRHSSPLHWRVVASRNDRGERLDELIDEARAASNYQEGAAKAAELKSGAKRLRKRADDLDRQARELISEADDRVAEKITAGGHVYAYDESISFRAASEEDDRRLIESGDPHEVLLYMLGHRGDDSVAVGSVAMNGDVRHEKYSHCMPHPPNVVGWCGIGNEMQL